MEIGLLLVIVGIVCAILSDGTLAALAILIGVALIVVPWIRAATGRR